MGGFASQVDRGGSDTLVGRFYVVLAAVLRYCMVLSSCLDVSWEHRHGSFIVLSAFLHQYHFGPEVGAFVLNDSR